MTPAFKRILLKLSGEALMGDLPYGADAARIAAIAEEIKKVHDRGVEIAVVVGGGNIWRGRQAPARCTGTCTCASGWARLRTRPTRP